MLIRAKNIKFLALALFFFCLCLALGTWQIKRGHAKAELIRQYENRQSAPPLTLSELKPKGDLLFYHTMLRGHFENEKTFLLDNKISQGKVGYEIYTPFKIDHSPGVILIDRGFVPMGKNRQTLPSILPKLDTIVSGILVLPPRYMKWGPMVDPNNHHAIKRLEYIDLKEISAIYQQALFPYLLALKEAAPDTSSLTPMPPERHYAYAFQWFALALTLLLLLWAFNRAEN